MKIAKFLPKLLFFTSVAAVLCQCQAPNPVTANVRRAILPDAPSEINESMSGLDDLARYMAGMPGPVGSRYSGYRNSSRWHLHTTNMNELWRQYSNYWEPRIDAFSGPALGDLRSPKVLHYPFSGPDTLFAMTFFPGAQNYVLCGLEGADMLPEVTALSDSERERGLDGLYTSVTTALNCSFFITKDMRVDLQRTAFRGTLPIVLVFLARMGYSIDAVEPVSLDGAGNLQSGAGNGSCPGYVVKCHSGFGGRKNIYYFKEDLSNGNLSGDRRYLAFVSSFGSQVTYLKSASFLMHSDEFSVIRSHILSQSHGLLQDDSGIPHQDLLRAKFAMSYYGNYSGVLDIFRSYYQPSLEEAYKTSKSGELDFSIGYKNAPGESFLMVGRR